MATVSPSRTDSNSRQGGENPNVTPAEPNSARLRDNSNTAGSGRERKASRQERIDDIFEAARARKLKLDQDSSTCSVQEGEADDPLSGPANQRTSSKKNNGERMDGSRREEAGTESSADEETHVFRRRGQGGDDEITMNYQSTAVNQNASQKTRKRGGIRNTPSTTSIRRRGMTHDPSQDAAGDEEDEHESWWARLLSNYGSLELENKGSVARDHLALGELFFLHIHPFPSFPMSHFASELHMLIIILNRTYIPCLAPNLSSIRLNWNSNHSIVPS